MGSIQWRKDAEPHRKSSYDILWEFLLADGARYLFAFQGHPYKGAVEQMTKVSIADKAYDYMVSQGVDYRTPSQIKAKMTDVVKSYKEAYEIVHDLEGEGNSRANREARAKEICPYFFEVAKYYEKSETSPLSPKSPVSKNTRSATSLASASASASEDQQVPISERKIAVPSSSEARIKRIVKDALDKAGDSTSAASKQLTLNQYLAKAFELEKKRAKAEILVEAYIKIAKDEGVPLNERMSYISNLLDEQLA